MNCGSEEGKGDPRAAQFSRARLFVWRETLPVELELKFASTRQSLSNRQVSDLLLKVE